MLDFGSVEKSVPTDKVCVELCRSLGSPRPTRISKVDTVQTKVFCVASDPLEIIEQRPRRVGADITTVQPDCYKHTTLTVQYRTPV